MYIVISGIDEGAESCKVIKAKNDIEAKERMAKEVMKYWGATGKSNLQRALQETRGKLYGAEKNMLAFKGGDGDSDLWFALFKV